MASRLAANALWELHNIKDANPAELKAAFTHGEVILREGVVPNCCYLITEGMVGATSTSDTTPDREIFSADATVGNRSFSVIGAHAFFAGRPSKFQYFGISEGTVYTLSSALLAERINNGNCGPIIKALIRDSDLSDDLRNVWEALDKPKGLEFEVFASNTLFELLRKRCIELGSDASVAAIPRF